MPLIHLDDDRISLSQSSADTGYAIASASSAKFIHHGHEDTAAAGAHRMAHGICAEKRKSFFLSRERFQTVPYFDITVLPR
jgi:hypothetical protein